MNVIAMRQERRRNQIQQIVETIKKAFSAGLDVDKEKLIYESCFQLGISRRTSLEYINVALTSINCSEISVNGRKIFKEIK